MAKTKKEEMETKEFKVYVPFSMKEDSDSEDIIKIKGWANYCGTMDEEGMGAFVDLVGDVIVPNGFDLKLWNKNPQLLWQHNRNYTCGKGTKATKKDEGLEIEAEVHKQAMEEKDWYKVSKGLVSYFSVGFRTVAGEWKKIGQRDVWFITKALLFEVSLVALPCNTESGFSIIKSLDGNGIYGGELGAQENFSQSTENKNQNQEEDTDMKVKFRDTLSAEDVAKLESLGLQEKLDETVDVDIKQFIAAIVKAELKMIEAAKADAEKQETERVVAEAKEKEFEALAEELSVTVDEAKGFSEDEIKEKRQAIEDAKNDDTETSESFKSLLESLENTTKELTVE